MQPLIRSSSVPTSPSRERYCGKSAKTPTKGRPNSLVPASRLQLWHDMLLPANRLVGLGRSIAEAALAEGHDVVASARCAGGTDYKECCHEIDPCRTSCSGHGIDRGAAHQTPLFQGHAGQHRRRDQHRLSRTFIGLAMYVPADVTARK